MDKSGISDMRNGWLAGVLSLILCLILIFSVAGGAQADGSAEWSNPYVVRTFVDEEGRQIDEIIVPGRPPEIKAAVAAVAEANPAMGINVLSNVPAFDWCYGCSATSAAMLMGYYDNNGYSNMYAGPTNGGLCPMDNSVWGPGIGGSDGECPLSATHRGIDGRTIRGHVDDYWTAYGSTEPDPFIGKWTEHAYGECTGDYMGTNQSLFGNADGETTFYWLTDGDPLVDFIGCEPDDRDGCHGLRLFAESRAYTVSTNYSQYIYGYQGSEKGFSFIDFQAEIDAGRPVLIQVEGHTMLGYGYDTSGQTIYIHDTWDRDEHSMTWGGTYGVDNLQHYGVTVIQLEPAEPTVPAVSIEPDAQEVMAGQTFTVDVWVDASDHDLIGISVGVGYDSTVMTTSEGQIIGHNLLGDLQIGPKVTDGMATYDLATNTPQPDVSGSLLTIEFTVDADAEPGDYDITLATATLLEPPLPGVDLDAEATDGTVTVFVERKGDFDGDGDIDLSDFVLFSHAYGSELGDDNYNPVGDFDDDGDIDIFDFVYFAAVYGT